MLRDMLDVIGTSGARSLVHECLGMIMLERNRLQRNRMTFDGSNTLVSIHPRNIPTIMLDQPFRELLVLYIISTEMDHISISSIWQNLAI